MVPTPLKSPGVRRGLGGRLQDFLAFLPVAGAELVGLQRIEDAQLLLRVTADIEAVDRDVLDHIVRIDDEGGAIGDALFRMKDAERVGQLLRIVGNPGEIRVGKPLVRLAPGEVDMAGVAYRATYIVDPHNVIQHVTVNGLNQGRNPAEAIRVLDALQTDELCPCNWQAGEDVLKPAA